MVSAGPGQSSQRPCPAAAPRMLRQIWAWPRLKTRANENLIEISELLW
jgi:hypothetical protein